MITVFGLAPSHTSRPSLSHSSPTPVYLHSQTRLSCMHQYNLINAFVWLRHSRNLCHDMKTFHSNNRPRSPFLHILTQSVAKMVFHTILALRKLRYDEQPNFKPATGSSNPYPGWTNQSGIACGPAGNNCAVEGNGRRGPGPLPLPGHIRAMFHGTGRSHDGDHSLFDLHHARAALNGHSTSQVLPQGKRGFGSDAYKSTPDPMYSLSNVSHFSISATSQTTDSFFGGLSSPAHTADIKSIWGQSSRGAQFSSSSMVPQASNSLFNFNFHNGVVSMASVAVISGPIKNNSYSWDVNRSVTAAQLISKTTTPKPYWAPVSDPIKQGFLAPEPFTQYPAESPAGYSSI